MHKIHTKQLFQNATSGQYNMPPTAVRGVGERAHTGQRGGRPTERP